MHCACATLHARALVYVCVHVLLCVKGMRSVESRLERETPRAGAGQPGGDDQLGRSGRGKTGWGLGVRIAADLHGAASVHHGRMPATESPPPASPNPPGGRWALNTTLETLPQGSTNLGTPRRIGRHRHIVQHSRSCSGSLCRLCHGRRGLGTRLIFGYDLLCARVQTRRLG